MSYNKGGDELRIKTNWGDLVASVGHDPNYPEIFITLEMPDRVEFTLAVIGQDGDCMRTRVKEVIPDEDFTLGIGFTDAEIANAWQEVIDNDCYDS